MCVKATSATTGPIGGNLVILSEVRRYFGGEARRRASSVRDRTPSFV
jgi:hypothetical protein